MDKRQDKLNNLRKEAEKEDHILAECFKGSNGEKTLDILKELFYDRPSYVQGDAYHTAFREGQRDVVGYIVQAIDTKR